MATPTIPVIEATIAAATVPSNPVIIKLVTSMTVTEPIPKQAIRALNLSSNAQPFYRLNTGTRINSTKATTLLMVAPKKGFHSKRTAARAAIAIPIMPMLPEDSTIFQCFSRKPASVDCRVMFLFPPIDNISPKLSVPRWLRRMECSTDWSKMCIWR